MRLTAWVAVLLAAGLVACDEESQGVPDAGAVVDTVANPDTGPGDDVGPETVDAPEPPPPCDDTKRPIVLAHGFLGSGDTFTGQFMRFSSNGYCDDRLFAFDWNSLDGAEAAVPVLDAYIDQVLAATGANEVDFGGHSAGGSLGYQYLDDATRAAKVAHYVHIGSGLSEGPAGPSGEIPTLNLWSESDMVIDDKGDIPGATNVMVADLDHYGIATHPESFAAMYRFFNDGAEPETTDIIPEEAPVVSGVALVLGDNAPLEGGQIDVYEVDPATAERLGAEPIAHFEVPADGSWGPLEARADARYEFVLSGAAEDDYPVHYYREPFVRSSRLVYLRGLPNPSSFVGALLTTVSWDDQHSVLVSFTSSQAVVSGRDTLTVGGTELSTPELAAADKTAIAYFLYDEGADGQSGGAIAAWEAFPFLSGVDHFLPAEPVSTITLEFNGRPLAVRSWPSASQGATVAVFD